MGVDKMIRRLPEGSGLHGGGSPPPPPPPGGGPAPGGGGGGGGGYSLRDKFGGYCLELYCAIGFAMALCRMAAAHVCR
jgi:hypothetical protein